MKKSPKKPAPARMSPELREQVDVFLASHRRRKSAPKTIEVYGHVLTTFGAFLATMGCLRAQDIRLTHLRQYVDQMAATPSMGAKTQHYHATVIYYWLKHLIIESAYDDEVDEDDAKWKLDMNKLEYFHTNDTPPEPEHRYPAVVWGQLEEFVTSVVKHDKVPAGLAEHEQLIWLRRRALYLVFWSTGARLSEVLSLNRNQIQPEISITGKGSKERTIFMSDDAIEACETYLRARHDHCAALFVSHHPRRPIGRITAWTVQRMMQEDRMAEHIANMTPHKFRHLVARAILKSTGGNMAVVQRVLGHTHITTTQFHYADLEDEFLSARLPEMHPAHKHRPKKMGPEVPYAEVKEKYGK